MKGQYPKASIEWQNGERPDFRLLFNNQEYAVEVTRVVDEHDRTVTASLWRVVDNAEEKAREANNFFGTYVVNFTGPIKTFKNWRNTLKDKILEYVSRTVLLQSHLGENIVVKEKTLCHIRKLDPRGAIIGCTGPNNGGGWEDDIRRDLRVLLKETFSKKTKKLNKINHPKVLILYDLYWFAKRNIFIECVRSIDQIDQFHTVYVVQNKNRSYVAYQAKSFL